MLQSCVSVVCDQSTEVRIRVSAPANDSLSAARTRPTQRLLMIRQFRYPVGKVLLEFPAGHVDKGEDPLDTAKRELEEETGQRARGSNMSTATTLQ